MIKNRSLYNILIISTGFSIIMGTLSIINSIQGVVVKSINKYHDDISWNAYIPFAIIYLFYSLSNFIAPSLLSIISTKQCLIISTFMLGISYSVFLYPIKYLLYIIATITGIFKGLLYLSQTKFIVENSDVDAIDRNNGIFWVISNIGIVIASLIFYLEFQNVNEIQDQIRQLTYSILIGFFMLACFLFFFLKKSIETIKIENSFNVLKNGFKLIKKQKMIFLLISSAYTGLNMVFLMSIYPTVIAYTKILGEDSIRLMGMYNILVGIGRIISGLLFTLLGNRIASNGNRSKIYFIGFLTNLITFVFMFLSHANFSTFQETKTLSFIYPSIWIICLNGFLFGANDCCFQTQIVALIRTIFKDKSDDLNSAVFLFRLIHSTGAAFTFLYSSFNLTLYTHLVILIITSSLNFISFLMVDCVFK